MIFFPMLSLSSFMLAIAPGIVQQQMMVECKDVTVSVNTEQVGDADIVVQQCRTKENFYGDFGDWKLITG
jgi:hypothetical protein